jgi:hypothetical protein
LFLNEALKDIKGEVAVANRAHKARRNVVSACTAMGNLSFRYKEELKYRKNELEGISLRKEEVSKECSLLEERRQ